jgi:AbrB family looped-hinge helix DNA binding protein
VAVYIAIRNATEDAMKTTVDRFGRVVVPKALRVRLGLRAGTEVDIEEAADGGLSLRPVAGESPLAVRGGVLVFTGAAVEDLEDAVAAGREERARRLSGMPSK